LVWTNPIASRDVEGKIIPTPARKKRLAH